LICMLALAAGCGGYGGDESSVESPGVVRSDTEYCELTLPEGWTWFPAMWAAESPSGTRMAFEDARYGRPANADWEEVIEEKVATARERTPQATISQTVYSLTVDYGPNAGYAHLQRFDTIGCQVTFSNAQDTRATEFETWQEIIASFRRISPDPEFTPPAS
jgi:hypothetical protein